MNIVTSTTNFSYELPNDRIARHPLPHRADAKLLLYKESQISESTFHHLVDHIPADALVVMNNTRVIPARIRFDEIEVFCLEPVDTSMEEALNACGHVVWKCMIGNNRKWKTGKHTLVHSSGVELHLERLENLEVKFAWETQHTFLQILELFGNVPLPPYMERVSDEGDTERYQTVFAQRAGAVAAPTASLHITENTLKQLQEKGVEMGYVTLHVGAGTFLPMKTEHITDHVMHGEVFSVSHAFLKKLYQHIHEGKPIIAVGTTSLRVLESLQYLVDKNGEVKSRVEQWVDLPPTPLPRRGANDIRVPAITTDSQNYNVQTNEQSPFLRRGLGEALELLIQHTEKGDLWATTHIMITPGFQFAVADGLITNFHQPGSTLLVLVSAFIGDAWKRIYDYALSHGFRFLSYGDGSLLWRKDMV